MFSIDEIKQFAEQEQMKLWGIAVVAGFMNGFLPVVSVLFIIFYAYHDSKHIAFDSPKLDHPDNLIKITPLEKGY